MSIEKTIEAEALEKYPKQWRGTTPSERVAHFDPNEERRKGYIAGRSAQIESEKKKDAEILELNATISGLRYAASELQFRIDKQNEHIAILKEINIGLSKEIERLKKDGFDEAFRTCEVLQECHSLLDEIDYILNSDGYEPECNIRTKINQLIKKIKTENNL